ncbi:DUF1461 domain-containing protein [Candidatus Woesearchaeota archaeon]|nr:DUF1461 domain-containing protein [Candidatus Woesearchaeota archaeon]
MTTDINDPREKGNMGKQSRISLLFEFLCDSTKACLGRIRQILTARNLAAGGFVIAIICFIFLANTQYMFFDKGFYYDEYEKLGVYSRISEGTAEMMTEDMLGFITGSSDSLTDMFNEKEKAHLGDVRRLFFANWLVLASLLAIMLLLALYINYTNRSSGSQVSPDPDFHTYSGLKADHQADSKTRSQLDSQANLQTGLQVDPQTDRKAKKELKQDRKQKTRERISTLKKLKTVYGKILVQQGFVMSGILVFSFIVRRSFSFFFTAFHRMFFSGSSWLFNPETDMMIVLLPQHFFVHATAAIVIRSFLFCIALSALGFFIKK